MEEEEHGNDDVMCRTRINQNVKNNDKTVASLNLRATWSLAEIIAEMVVVAIKLFILVHGCKMVLSASVQRLIQRRVIWWWGAGREVERSSNGITLLELYWCCRRCRWLLCS